MLKTNYMATIENWLRADVFAPIIEASKRGNSQSLEEAQTKAARMIKNKILESYKNGIKSANAKTKGYYGQK